jgi:hypothetical protein
MGVPAREENPKVLELQTTIIAIEIPKPNVNSLKTQNPNKQRDLSNSLNNKSPKFFF